MSELKTRDEIEEKYKWRLEDIFRDEAEYKKAEADARKTAVKLEEYRGRLCENAETLFFALSLSDKLGNLLLSLNAYASMRRDEDNDKEKFRAMSDRAAELEAELSAVCAFVEPELIAAGREMIDGYIESHAPLYVYRHFFDDLFRTAEHTLDADGERLLALASPTCEAPSDIFSAMNNADIRFGVVKDESGADTELTQSRYGALLESRDRLVRRGAYEAMYKQYRAYKNTFAALFASNAKSDAFCARVRGYSSVLDMRLSADGIEAAVYDRLTEAAADGIPALGEYLKLRSKALKLDTLYMYDLYTPIVEYEWQHIPYEKAQELVLAAVAPLGAQYAEDMRKAFSERWIDVYENRGKTSGAYSWGDNDAHPFVLLNYQGRIDDVFTLAHEMGHAMHSFYTNNTQPSVYKGYKIFVAEVASTVNEALLLEYLLKNAKSVGERAYLLNRKLEEIRTTFFRQTMFAEFERDVHALYADGTALTAGALCEAYLRLNEKYYAPEVTLDESISYEWARIPHFYTSFYVYQYATGYAAASEIKARVLRDASAASDYLRFLSGGSSDYPLSLLARAGADLRERSVLLSVVKEFGSATAELSKLIGK